jgi:hypothetical protein
MRVEKSDDRARNARERTPILTVVMPACYALRAVAQDPFEIHIYEFEPMSRGQYSLEAHLNLIAQGTED